MSTGETEPSRGFLIFGICSAVFKAPSKPKEAFGELRSTWGSSSFGTYGVGWERRGGKECGLIYSLALLPPPLTLRGTFPAGEGEAASI